METSKFIAFALLIAVGVLVNQSNCQMSVLDACDILCGDSGGGGVYPLPLMYGRGLGSGLWNRLSNDRRKNGGKWKTVNIKGGNPCVSKYGHSCLGGRK